MIKKRYTIDWQNISIMVIIIAFAAALYHFVESLQRIIYGFQKMIERILSAMNAVQWVLDKKDSPLLDKLKKS